MAMSISLGMTFIDQTAVAIALPKIQNIFHISPILLQWIMNAYLLTLAVFLTIAGRLGDIYQHHRIFVMGLIIFLFASIACAIAPNIGWLIASRVIQGLGAALMIPNSVVIIINIFGPDEKGKAMGIYVGSAFFFLTFALMLGGLLIQFFSWRMIFWLNLPLSCLSLLIVYYFFEPLAHSNAKEKIDWAALITLTLASSILVYAIMESSNITLFNFMVLMLISAIFFVIYYVLERHSDSPFIDISVFRNKLFLSTTILSIGMSIAPAIFIFDAIFYQNILGLQPAVAGFAFLPNIIFLMLASPIAGKIYDLYGYRTPVITGLLLVILGLLWKAIFAVYQNYWFLLPGIICFSVGAPFIQSPMNTAALSSIELKRRGTASGLLNAVRQISTSMSLAILTTIIVGSNHYLLTKFLTANQKNYPTFSVLKLENLLQNQMVKDVSLSANELTSLHHHASLIYTLAYSIGHYICSFFLFITLLLILGIFKQLRIDEKDFHGLE